MSAGQYEVGDTAYISNGNHHRVSVVMGVVAKVTPSGQVTVKHGERSTRFLSTGWEIGAGTYRGARLIDAEMYGRLRATMLRQRAEGEALAALLDVSKSRATAANKNEVLALIEAARIAVEAL